MRFLRTIGMVAVCAWFYSSTASAQIMGTVFLDFDGEAGTPQGTVTAFDASIFPGLVVGDTTALKAAILSGVQA